MIFIAIPEHVSGQQLDEAMNQPNGGGYAVDSFFSDDQEVVADWAQARALQTRTDYQVFRLVETLYYKGKR